MPIFEYICKQCDHQFEALVYGDQKAECPKCHGSKLAPQLSVFAVSAKGELSATSPTVFKGGAESASAKSSGAMWMLGTELKLVFFKLGVEYTNLLNTSRFTGKLAFYF